MRASTPSLLAIPSCAALCAAVIIEETAGVVRGQRAAESWRESGDELRISL